MKKSWKSSSSEEGEEEGIGEKELKERSIMGTWNLRGKK
jgi:hypothetical protein